MAYNFCHVHYRSPTFISCFRRFFTFSSTSLSSMHPFKKRQQHNLNHLSLMLNSETLSSQNFGNKQNESLMWLLSFGCKAFCASQVKNLISLMDLFCFVHVTKSVKREKDKRINFRFFWGCRKCEKCLKKICHRRYVVPHRQEYKSKTRSSIDIHRNKYGVITGMRFAIFMKISSPKFPFAVIWTLSRADKQSSTNRVPF